MKSPLEYVAELRDGLGSYASDEHVAAIFMRNEATEPRRECPGCGKVVPAHDALCTRCGTELYLPDDDQMLPSKFEERLHGK